MLFILLAALVTGGADAWAEDEALGGSDGVAADDHATDAAGHGEAGEDHAAPHLDGGQLNLIWVVPFVGILLSVAIFPLVLPHFWHRYFGGVSAFWALAFLVPFGILFGADLALLDLLHVALLEYLPFIMIKSQSSRSASRRMACPTCFVPLSRTGSISRSCRLR